MNHRKLMAIVLGLSLLTSVGSYTKEAKAQELSFIDVQEKLDEEGFLDDFPFGIECRDPNSVYVTVFEQGLLARIDKDTRVVVEIIDDPDTEIVALTIGTQNFFDITRDPSTGNLFINERDNGKLWRFDPSAPLETAWTRIPIIERVIDFTPGDGLPVITYPNGFDVTPTLVEFDNDGDGIIDESPPPFFAGSFGGVEFASGNVWVGLDYFEDLFFSAPDAEFLGAGGEDSGPGLLDFVGLAKVNPTTLEVNRISLLDDGALSIEGVVVDSVDPNVLWLTDLVGEQVFKFDITTETVEATIPVDALTLDFESLGLNPFVFTDPAGIDTDDNNVFVALNILNIDDPGEEDNSLIAQIDKLTLDVSIIDTGAPNTDLGTFTVFVNSGLLVWTDQSQHVGIIDLNTFESIPDTTTGLPFFTTEFSDSNHFGCVPVDGEFWFAGRGSAVVGILPNSKFSVGPGVGRPTSKQGGGHKGRTSPFADPNRPNYDGQAPIIGEVFTAVGSLKVYAEISDTVGVKDANIILGKKMIIPMEHHAGSQNWWVGTIPSSEVPAYTVFFKIVASDFNDNIVEYSGSAEVPPGASSSSSHGASFVISALPYLDHQADPAYSIIASDVEQGDSNVPARITIKNTSSEPLQNIRLILSSELKGKFLLSDYAIRSIDPNSEFTVSIIMNGNPNVDVMKQPIPYKGQIIVSVDNRTPYVYELSGRAPSESAPLSLFMNTVASKAEQRYKSFEKPDVRISGDARYEVILASGGEAIKSASDELIVKNTGDKPLKNLRIITSTLGSYFLPDQKNIAFLPAGTYIKVKLISKLNNAESPTDLKGELLVVPENGVPLTIPIDIDKRLPEDKNSMYEVRTISGNEVISNTADGIIIRNKSDEAIKSVRLILPRELARVFSLSEDSFKSIEPNSEKTVYLQQRGTLDSISKQILNNYNGEIIIVSENGMKKIVPVEISWNGISSEHFVVYARNNAGEVMKATQLINFLEHNYAKVTELSGEPSTKTVIYMLTSLDELRMLTGTLASSTYVYGEDLAFVWSNSEDFNILALKEFAHRTIMKNYASYWTTQKVYMDNGNWLIDGVVNYVTAKIVGERGMIRDQTYSFVEEPTLFEWYGAATPSQYGATYTLFKFLSEKYGNSVVEHTLDYLGSSMINNHRCETFEQCALLRAVYDVNGLNINEKRYDLSFASVVEEWDKYVQENYGISEDESK
ncbi:MAG: hypothetical protein ACE5J2_08460 [Nitrososphaerales archaeon]